MLTHLLSFFSLLSLTGSLAFAGANTSGGGSPATVSAGALKLLIEGEGLKKAMLNYVETVIPSQIEDALVRTQLVKMMKQGALAEDIRTSRYVLATPNSPCKDAYNTFSPASTNVGKPGSDVCFDIAKLLHSFEGLNEEDVMVQLASLAFHEHTHHFQVFSGSAIAQNEDQANRVSGYILVTAKFVQLPLLRWVKPGSGPAEFQNIQMMYTAIKAKEQAFIAPSTGDYANYPGYQGQKDRGVLRLLPRETYNGKLSIPGGGAYFSFTRLTHDYGYGSDIELSQKSLSSGFAGCDFGFFANLGNVEIETLNEQSPSLQFLLNFKPGADEPSIRKQQALISSDGLSSEEIQFPRRIKNPQPGQTFALRSINFDHSDSLVVLKIIRIDGDGSLILAWKKLKSFPVPSCR